MLHYNGNTLGNHGEARDVRGLAPLPQWLICNDTATENCDLFVSARDTIEARRIYWEFIALQEWPAQPGDVLSVFRVPAPVTGEGAAHAWQREEKGA